jgi:hypothetical protein
MPGRVCYHCKQTIPEGEPHDCWTTTEDALTKDLPPDLQEAYERIRETAVEFGEQRIYASHKSIMFSRKSCYFFVRPRKKDLELWFFLAREVEAPQIRRVDRSSKKKVAHMIRVTHRDEIESPSTGWLREAYDLFDAPPEPEAKPRSTAANAPAPRRATAPSSSKRGGSTARSPRAKR